MKIIGLCGSSGSGKGYVSKKFEELDAYAIDTDRLYREKTARRGGECLNELVIAFGKEILCENGELNKKALSKIVYSQARLDELNKITHKHIMVDTLDLVKKAEENGKEIVVIDAPVLFESGFDKLCDYTVCVLAPEEKKLERILKRDQITMEMAQKRLSCQLSDSELRARCDFHIINDDKEDIKSQIISILEKINKL